MPTVHVHSDAPCGVKSPRISDCSRRDDRLGRETSPAVQSDPLLVAEMKEHLERYHEVLATLQAPANNPAVLQEVIGDLEPIAL